MRERNVWAKLFAVWVLLVTLVIGMFAGVKWQEWYTREVAEESELFFLRSGYSPTEAKRGGALEAIHGENEAFINL